MSLLENRAIRFAGNVAKKGAEKTAHILPFPIEISVPDGKAERIIFSNDRQDKPAYPRTQKLIAKAVETLTPEEVKELLKVGTGFDAFDNGRALTTPEKNYALGKLATLLAIDALSPSTRVLLASQGLLFMAEKGYKTYRNRGTKPERT